MNCARQSRKFRCCLFLDAHHQGIDALVTRRFQHQKGEMSVPRNDGITVFGHFATPRSEVRMNSTKARTWLDLKAEASMASSAWVVLSLDRVSKRKARSRSFRSSALRPRRSSPRRLAPRTLSGRGAEVFE